jgi:pimeloyl-ACP methyl ester carboxylesterase
MDKTTWRDPALGTPGEIALPSGSVRYFDAGRGEPLVFVHGLLVNANLWRHLVSMLEREFRCICLDLPLGSHTTPMPSHADLRPPALADVIGDALERLCLDDVTLIGNDTGGALCQLLITGRPDRIGRMVLTSCDYRHNFPPAMFRYLKVAARIPGALPVLLAQMRVRRLRRLPVAYGWLTSHRLDPLVEDSYMRPSITIPGVRRDLRRVLRALDPQYTNEAADRLRHVEKPALIAWSAEDRVFSASDAEQLARDLPNARLEWVRGARTFSPEDQPGRLSALISDFARAGTPSGASPL